MKILMVSDTHGYIPDTTYWPEADVFIHSGDFMRSGYRHYEVKEFGDWLSSLPYKNKIFVAGNHDRMVESNLEYCLSKFPKNLIYLQDSSVTIDGVKFFGSPQTPFFYAWAFNVMPDVIGKYWEAIPDDTNVLITHGPPKGILDALTVSRPGMSPVGEPLGCPELRHRIGDLKDLKLHVFGHIHGGKGVRYLNGTYFVNASYVDEDYIPVGNAFTYLEI